MDAALRIDRRRPRYRLDVVLLHNERVLAGLLGLTRADLDRLAASNIIGTEALRRTLGTGWIAAE
jgi:hypothetical protein